jgi:serine/threonine protein phosphatase PrpC
MATKKHRNFEYAGQTGGLDGEGRNLHSFQCFDTPNGFAFVVVGADRELGPDQSPGQGVIERLKYYLEIEEEASPAEAVRNALVYVNGYLYSMSRKDPAFQPGELSCLCVLFREEKVYYAWVGQVCLHLFTGKKLVPLSWEVYSGDEGGKSVGNRPWKLAFLGKQQFLDPGVCREALVPVDGDMLILGSSGYCLNPDEKQIRKVLPDVMPLHTKVQRLISQTGKEEEEAPMAVVLIGFYNMGQEERSFVAGSAIPEHQPGKEAQPGNALRLLSNPLLKKILIGLGVLFLVYMLYDLFWFNPRPARQIAVTERDIPGLDSIPDTLGVLPVDQPATPVAPPAVREPQVSAPAADPASGTPAPLPADREYTVRSGDTWGRIYREFEVCSWFIRNHPPNSGKFDRSDNPIAGTRLMIPVKYSASRRLNPAYYQEFTTDKVGSACQNANRNFLRRFEESLQQPSQ